MSPARPSPTRDFTDWARWRLTRRLLRSIPYVGAVFVLIGVNRAVERKGLVGGVVDSGLDALPWIGAAKNAVELVRGRDFIPERPGAGRRGERTASRRAATS